MRRYTVQPRLSYEALERFLQGCDQQERRYARPGAMTNPHRVSVSAVAQRIGVDRVSVYRYRREDIPLYSADEIAVRLGVHPLNIWPDFHQEVMA